MVLNSLPNDLRIICDLDLFKTTIRNGKQLTGRLCKNLPRCIVVYLCIVAEFYRLNSVEWGKRLRLQQISQLILVVAVLKGYSRGMWSLYIYITTWRKIILSFYFILHNIFDISMTCDMCGVMERRLDQRSRSNR